jgi:hypothetical protein
MSQEIDIEKAIEEAELNQLTPDQLLEVILCTIFPNISFPFSFLKSTKRLEVIKKSKFS